MLMVVTYLFASGRMSSLHSWNWYTAIIGLATLARQPVIGGVV